jgi:hypothetical protein
MMRLPAHEDLGKLLIMWWKANLAHRKRLLFQDRGTYDHLSWDTYLQGDFNSNESQLISLHEFFHSELDRTTDYGTLVTAYAYLSKLPKTSGYERVLDSLVKYCQQTHESFATYLSVLLMTANAKLTMDEVYQLLSSYSSYYRLTDDLVGKLSNNYLKYHASLSILRTCMQAPVTAKAVRRGFADFRLRDLGRNNLPDERLYSLRRHLTGNSEFWNKTLSAIRDRHPDFAGWQQLEKGQNEGREFRLLFEASNDRFSEVLMTGLQDAVSHELLQLGMETLPYDGHIGLVNAVIREISNVLQQPVENISLISAEGNQHLAVAAFNFADERLVVNHSPMIAYLTRTADLADPEIASTVSGSGADRHYFIAVRRASKLLAQYAFVDQPWLLTSSYLEERKDDFVCFIQRGGWSDDERQVELFLIDSPAEFERFIAICGSSLEVFCNVPLSALADEKWQSEWFAVLQQHTHATILFDVTPFYHFSTWYKQKGAQFEYGLINLNDGASTFSAFACYSPTATFDNIMIAPCSQLAQNALHHHLQTLNTEGEAIVYVQKDDFLTNSSRLLTMTLPHLFRDECYFDFQVRALL